MDTVGIDHPFRPLTQGWIKKIRLAWEDKKAKFQDDADEAMRFFSGPYDWMYDIKSAGKDRSFTFTGDSADLPRPTFCLVADTPVRMADGTEKPIQDVRVGDTVVTHTGQHRKVLRLFQRPYEGELVKITMKGFPFPLTMTADHKMAIATGDSTVEWVSAERIAVNDPMLIGWSKSEQGPQSLDMADLLGGETQHLDAIMADGAYANLGISENVIVHTRRKLRRGVVDWHGRVKLPRTQLACAVFRHVAVTPSLARLIGLYLAEGSLYRGGIEFTFGHDEDHYASETLALMRGIFGVDGTLVRNPHVIRVKFNNKNVRAIFGELCPGKAKTKRVPALFFNAAEDVKIALLLGWLHGDGHSSYKKNHKQQNVLQIVGVTVSPGLARDMTVLALSCGLRAKCNLLRGGYGNSPTLNTSDRYTVNFAGSKAVALFPAVHAQAVAAGMSFKEADYEKSRFGCIRKVKDIQRWTDSVTVYDFEVEEDHSFLANDTISHNCMTINKVAELVQLFGPALYHRNPVRKVTPRKPWVPPIDLFGPPEDPMVQAYHQQQTMQATQAGTADRSRAALYEQYLNFTPSPLGLHDESRCAIDEALIKGLGLLWTEPYQPRGGQMTLAGSFYGTVDDLVIDPDAEDLRHAWWIARRCVHPYWQVEREYGLEPDTLRNRASLESRNAAGEVSADPSGDYNRRRGMSNDLVVYWKVWSKMGVGGRLSGMDPSKRERADLLGEYVYLVVADGVGFPLNMPPPVAAALMEDDLAAFEQAFPIAQQVLQWPTPFWADDAWPFTPVAFHWVPRQVWPMSHVKPGMGELKFLNWAYSFLAGKVRTSSRDFIAIAKSTAETLKESIRTGPDYTMLEVEALHGSIDNVVKFLQHPPFNKDIFTVVEQVADNFEKRTGLTELLYGMTSTQMRSAAEADSKENMATIRPDDMANKVEVAMSHVARKEALVARWHLEATDMAPVLGDLGAQWWQTLVLNESPEAVLHGLEFRVEAGSAKKPNKAREASNMQQAMQTLFQPLLQLAMTTGMVNPVNALLLAWAKSIDLDVEKFLLPTPPPPVMPPAVGGPPAAMPGPTMPGPPMPMM